MVWDGKLYSEFYSIPNLPGRNAVVLSDRYEDVQAGWSASVADALFDGFVAGERTPLANVLSSARTKRLRPERDPVNGSACYVLEAVHATGTYTVWLDPTRDFHVAKLTVKRTADDEFNGMALSKIFTPHPDAADRPELILANVDVEAVEFSRFGQTWFPVKARYESRYEYADGEVQAETGEVTRTEMEALPQARRSAFIHEIPDGTRVREKNPTDADPKEWRDGKVVPRAVTR
jgi:hypothetical protein